ncbi:MAG: TolC family protein [Gemmatimonadaceae bacterium]|nr:TolC family protein [Gloeobacterales cyanobacterium ES-bin-141]
MLIGAVLAAQFPLAPAGAQVLSLEEALTLTLERSPRAIALRRRLVVSEAGVLTAGAVPNPSLTVGDADLVGREAKATFLFFEQPFELGGKRDARLTLADAGVALARAEIAESLWQLRSEVRKAHTELSVARADLGALTEVAASGERLVQVAEQRLRLGDIPELDLIRARQELAALRNEVRAGRARVVVAEVALGGLIARPPEEPIEVPPASQFALKVQTDSFLPPDPNDAAVRSDRLRRLIDQALARRPQLRVLDAQLGVASAEKRLAEAERAPDLTLGLGPRFEREEADRLGVAARVALTLPLWYRQEGQIARAEAQGGQLAAERDALARQVIAEVQSSYARILAAREQIDAFEETLLPGAREVEQISRLAYERGKSDLTVSINAQTAGILTRQRYHRAVLDYQVALADLERAVGAPLTI